MASPLQVDTQFQQINPVQWQELFALAQQLNFAQHRADLFSGEPVNFSEKRPALHTALRNLNKTPVFVNDLDVMPAIEAVWRQIDNCCNQLSGITDIIYIGIGGSDFGPRLVCDALRHQVSSDKSHLHVHFLSNVDSADLASILAVINAKSTQVIIASKAFTTLETMQNATAVIAWLKEQGLSQDHISKNIFAITANPPLAKQFGVLSENVFPFWDWVGGRFYVW